MDGINVDNATITDCTVTNNGSYGIVSGTATISNCTITNNGGKGISVGDTATITDCIVTDNGEGGISVYGAATITRCTVSRNSNGNSGVGIRHSGIEGLLTITDCTVTDNAGMGIDSYSYNATTITGCVVTDNGDKGIRITLYGTSSATITDCTIARNSGTGIYCYYNFSNTASANIKNCIIRDNLDADGGEATAGGIAFKNIESHLTNCLIIGNISNSGYTGGVGGVLISSFLGTSSTVTNCTIAGNEGYYLYGGLDADYLSDVTVRNTIVYGNTPDASRLETINPVSVSYSDIAGYSGAGAGNIDKDPLFVGSGDYRLSANSPCIDTGTANGAPDTDIENTSRPQGSGYDMGAYEYILYCPQCSGDPVELEDTTFEAGPACQCRAATLITISKGVYIKKDANITFKAPKVIIKSFFHAENGSMVSIKQE